MHLRNIRGFLLGSCVTLALLGGAYFGLFACGGYAWKWQLYDWLELLISGAWIVATIASFRAATVSGRSLWRTILVCALFYPGVHLLFFTTMASVSPFYPAPPQSFNDWWRGFLFTWREGVPC
jgi:hypothetical protein